MKDSENFESIELFDGKEIYLQVIDPKQNWEYFNPKFAKDAYYVLFREWDSSTGALGVI